MTTRLKPDDRRDLILTAAILLSTYPGQNYRSWTREEVADLANVAPGLISHYFQTMDNLRDETMRYAVRLSRVPVVAQGLAVRDRIALDAPDDLKEAAARWLIGG
jgi:AcrR family transcriptional regulator